MDRTPPDGENIDRVAWRNLVVEEYKTLRDESLQAQRQHHHALQLGFSGLAILVVIAAGLHTRSVAAVVLLGAVPLLVYAMLLIWLGELRRMVRAGAFLVEVEKRLNDSLGGHGPALTWETTLRQGQGPQIRLTNLYRAIFSVLMVFVAIAVAGGVVVLGELHLLVLAVVIAPLEAAAAARMLDFFARAEIALHDAGRGAYVGSAFERPRPDLRWPRPVHAILDAWAVVRRKTLLPLADDASPRIALPMLGWAAVTGSYPRWVQGESPDCIAAFAFGQASAADGTAGASNEKIAEAVSGCARDLPIVAQEEVAVALGRSNAVSVSSRAPDGSYRDTRAVAVVIQAALATHGYRRPLIATHPCHVGRACAVMASLGVECAPLENLEGVGFDKTSTQKWTRRRARWASRELGVLLLYWRRGWLTPSPRQVPVLGSVSGAAK